MSGAIPLLPYTFMACTRDNFTLALLCTVYPLSNPEPRMKYFPIRPYYNYGSLISEFPVAASTSQWPTCLCFFFVMTPFTSGTVYELLYIKRRWLLQSLVIFYKLVSAVHHRAVDSSKEYPALVDDWCFSILWSFIRALLDSVFETFGKNAVDICVNPLYFYA